MDNAQFDRWTQELGMPRGRRAVLGLVAGLAAGAGMGTIGQPGTDAKAKKHADKKCKSPSVAKTCSGKCGKVSNKCHKQVDCGPCAPACLANGTMYPPNQGQLCCDGAAGAYCSKNCLTNNDCLANQTCFDFGPTKLCLTM